MITVMLVEARSTHRSRIRDVLSRYAGIGIVAEAPTGGEALRLANAARPDVVLLGLPVADLDTATLVARMTEELADVHVLMLSTHEDHSDVLPGVAAGAVGYLLEDVTAPELAAALTAAANGETVIPHYRPRTR